MFKNKFKFFRNILLGLAVTSSIVLSTSIVVACSSSSINNSTTNSNSTNTKNIIPNSPTTLQIKLNQSNNNSLNNHFINYAFYKTDENSNNQLIWLNYANQIKSFIANIFNNISKNKLIFSKYLNNMNNSYFTYDNFSSFLNNFQNLKLSKIEFFTPTYNIENQNTSLTIQGAKLYYNFVNPSSSTIYNGFTLSLAPDLMMNFATTSPLFWINQIISTNGQNNMLFDSITSFNNFFNSLSNDFAVKASDLSQYLGQIFSSIQYSGLLNANNLQTYIANNPEDNYYEQWTTNKLLTLAYTNYIKNSGYNYFGKNYYTLNHNVPNAMYVTSGDNPIFSGLDSFTKLIYYSLSGSPQINKISYLSGNDFSDTPFESNLDQYNLKVTKNLLNEAVSNSSIESQAITQNLGPIGYLGQMSIIKDIIPTMKFTLGMSFGSSNTFNNSTQIQTQVQDLFNLMLFYNFSGINLDFEFPNQTQEVNQYFLLINQIRNVFTLLRTITGHYNTISITSGSHGPEASTLSVGFAPISTSINFVDIMDYDNYTSGGWPDPDINPGGYITGPNSFLFSPKNYYDKFIDYNEQTNQTFINPMNGQKLNYTFNKGNWSYIKNTFLRQNTTSNASLYEQLSFFNAWNIPNNKIVLGMPSYVYGGQTENNSSIEQLPGMHNTYESIKYNVGWSNVPNANMNPEFQSSNWSSIMNLQNINKVKLIGYTGNYQSNFIGNQSILYMNPITNFNYEYDSQNNYFQSISFISASLENEWFVKKYNLYGGFWWDMGAGMPNTNYYQMNINNNQVFNFQATQNILTYNPTYSSFAGQFTISQIQNTWGAVLPSNFWILFKNVDL